MKCSHPDYEGRSFLCVQQFITEVSVTIAITALIAPLAAVITDAQTFPITVAVAITNLQATAAQARGLVNIKKTEFRKIFRLFLKKTVYIFFFMCYIIYKYIIIYNKG